MTQLTVLKRQAHNVPILGAVAARGIVTQHSRGMVYTRTDSSELPNIATGSLYCAPLYLYAGTLFDQAAANFSAGNSDGLLRAGIYETDEDNGGPGQLLQEFGTISEPAAAGGSSVTISWRVPYSGIYWFAVLSEDALISLRSYNGSGLFLARANESQAWGYQKLSVTTGSMPNPFPAAPTLIDQGPAIMLHVVESPPLPSPPKRVRVVSRPMPHAGEEVQEGVVNIGVAGNVTVAQDALYLMPIIIQQHFRVATIELSNVASAAPAGSKGRLLLYSARMDNKPDQLMLSAEVAIDSTGGKSVSIAFDICPGLYWIGFYNDGSGNVGVERVSPDGCLVFGTTITGFPHVAIVATTGSIPNPFSGSIVGALTAPNVQLNGGVGLSLIDDAPDVRHLRRFVPGWANLSAPDWYIGPGAPWVKGTDKYLLGLNTTFATPLIVPRRATFDRIGVAIADAPGGSSYTYRFGLYNNHGFRPSESLRKFGTVTVTTTGDKTVTIDETLDAGIYWLTINNEGGSGSAQSARAITGWAIDIANHRSGAGSPGMGSEGSGAFPNPWNANVSHETAVNLFMRLKEYVT